MFRTILLGALVMLAACANPKEDNAASEAEKDAPAPLEAKKEYESTFIFEKGDQRQQLAVSYKSETEIEFYLSFEKGGNCKNEISGKAENKNAGGDAETDDDNEGNAYAVNEFLYENGNCVIAIRIATDEKDKATVQFSGCGSCVEQSELLMLNK
jgi:hypothetical protein